MALHFSFIKCNTTELIFFVDVNTIFDNNCWQCAIMKDLPGATFNIRYVVDEVSLLPGCYRSWSRGRLFSSDVLAYININRTTKASWHSVFNIIESDLFIASATVGLPPTCDHYQIKPVAVSIHKEVSSLKSLLTKKSRWEKNVEQLKQNKLLL